MPAAPPRQHKFSKGETLLEIARKHGHGDARAIWSFAANKALVGKRRKPEALEPGDLIAIPPTAKELKERQERLAWIDKALEAEWELVSGLRAVGRRIDDRIKPLNDALLAYDTLVAQVTDAVDALQKSLPDSTDAVQAARRTVQAGAGIQKACKSAMATLRGAGAKLAGTRADVRSAVNKKLALGGLGELVAFDEESKVVEQALDALFRRLDAPFKDLGRTAWWAAQAIALRDLAAWSPGAAVDRAEEIAGTWKSASRQAAEWRRELSGELGRTNALARQVELMESMSEMRRLHGGQMRADAA